MKILMLLLKILRGFGRAFICMTIHRNLKMIHISGGEHEVLCKTCQGEISSIENIILTYWYFNTGWYDFLIFLPMTIAAAFHKLLTGWPGHFEHPPEHSD